MPKLITLLALLSAAGLVTARPPEGVSTKMAFDRVGAGLLRYRHEKDQKRRIEWLKRLAPTRDARVAVEIGEYLEQALPNEDLIVLGGLMAEHFQQHPPEGPPLQHARRATQWWYDNRVELRRRAAALASPR
jgi:hypothetical protein